jgi:hypothetical protein
MRRLAVIPVDLNQAGKSQAETTIVCQFKALIEKQCPR